MIDKYDAKKETKNLNSISKLRKKTKLDGSFQRYGGHDRGSGWSKEEGIEYLTNLLVGCTFNIILNVDVKEAFKYAGEQADKESKTYFGKILAEGYEYLSVDGNNSSSFIAAFVEDDADILVPSADDPRPDRPRRRFSAFSEDEQEDIKYVEKVEVVTLRRISIREVCDLFRHLNTSTQLNPQEWRQARWSGLSAFVRDASNGSNRTLFKNFVFANNRDLDKRFHEEMVAQLSLKVKNNYGGTYIDKFRLDAFYEDTPALDPSEEKNVHHILSETLQMAASAGQLKKKLTKGKLHNLFDVVQILTLKQKFKILDYKKFFNWFLEKDSEFVLESKNVIEADKEKKSYEYWTVSYNKGQWYRKTRHLFENVLAQDADTLISDNVIAPPDKQKSYYKWIDKLKLMRAQDNKTRKGSEISYLDLYLGKLEADHMKSQQDGGDTTFENGELMTAHENRKKGPNSNQPHFQHQQ
jgi:hypothetical protein